MGKMMMVLSLGSNYGNRREAVNKAIGWLETQLSDTLKSDIYETLPVGLGDRRYMNAVIAGDYDGDVRQLERMCKVYESEHGRDLVARQHNIVPIDIDIVIAGGVILRQRDFRCSFFQIGFSSLGLPDSGY